MKTQKEMPTDYDQIVKLSSLKNLAHRVADATIKEHGFYTCTIEGIKTLVIPDNEWM